MVFASVVKNSSEPSVAACNPTFLIVVRTRCPSVPTAGFSLSSFSRDTSSNSDSATPAARPVSTACSSETPRSFASTIALVAAAPPSSDVAASGGTPSAASPATAVESSMLVPML